MKKLNPENNPHKRINKNSIKGIDLNQASFPYSGGVDLMRKEDCERLIRNSFIGRKKLSIRSNQVTEKPQAKETPEMEAYSGFFLFWFSTGSLHLFIPKEFSFAKSDSDSPDPDPDSYRDRDRDYLDWFLFVQKVKK